MVHSLQLSMSVKFHQSTFHETLISTMHYPDYCDNLAASCSFSQGREMHHNNNDDILDISSGLLHLTGSTLVPDSISRECLENARVLLQVDRKFIPVMAGDTLIIIDQVFILIFF